MEEKADAIPELPPATFEVAAAHPFKLAQKSKPTWPAKTPGRVSAGKILEEYNRLHTPVIKHWCKSSCHP